MTEILYPEIAREIERMTDKDQKMRETAGNDTTKWDVSVDHRNTGRMKEIVSEDERRKSLGMPSFSEYERSLRELRSRSLGLS